MYGNNNGNNYAQNFPFYNSSGNPANTLSHIQQGEEDAIAQSLGLQTPQQQQAPVQQQTNNAPPPNLQQRAQYDPNFQDNNIPQSPVTHQLPQMPFRPQQLPTVPQMNINGRSISISLSPDGTVTITIS